jgi:hypothetical protein
LFSLDNVITALEFCAAFCGVAAAVMWVAAAFYPGGIPEPMPYMPGDLNHPLWEEMRKHGDKIPRGAKLNNYAAYLAVVAAMLALASFLANHI